MSNFSAAKRQMYNFVSTSIIPSDENAYVLCTNTQGFRQTETRAWAAERERIKIKWLKMQTAADDFKMRWHTIRKCTHQFQLSCAIIISTALSRHRRQLNYIAFNNCAPKCFPKNTTHKKTTDEWHNVVNLWFLSEKSISLARTKWHNESYECIKEKQQQQKTSRE